MNNSRQHLCEIYKAALESVQGVFCVRKSLKQLDIKGLVAVVAIGKAAASMMKGAVSGLDKQIAAGMIITKAGHCGDQQIFIHGRMENIECIESGHPVPDASSLRAGSELFPFINSQPLSRTMVFLISGGASSLVESLVEGVSLRDLQKVNQWLLGSGLDITAMNKVRAHLSSIKGGKLAKYMGGRKVINLMISDVCGDMPHVIGSGLLSVSEERQQPLLEVFKCNLPDRDIPDWLEQLLLNRLSIDEEAPLVSDDCYKAIDTHIIATIKDAMQAAGTVAQTIGYNVILHEDFMAGDAVEKGKEVANILRNSSPGLHIWGGETTVRLPEHPGRGGRNQHLALAAATVLDGCNDCWLLAAGTDGSDGPTADAGALVDGKTISRGISTGFEAETTLLEANAGAFLAASGDLLRTGPTGTNVMDLVFGLKIKS